MNIVIRSLDPDRQHAAFLLATQVFSNASTLHSALEVALEDYRAYLWPGFQDLVSQGLSVAAIDAGTGLVVGCMIVTDFVNQPTGDLENHPVMAPLSALAAALGRQYEAKRDLSAGQAILVDMGAVSPQAEGMGVYQAMRKKVHEIAKVKGFKYAVGELSSVATQHVVLNRFGHIRMAEIFFQDFEFDGAFPFRSIKDPKSIVLAEGAI